MNAPSIRTAEQLSEDPVPQTRLCIGGLRAQPDRRKEKRFAAGFPARLRSSNGEQAEVTVADVSLHGCSVNTDAKWIGQGKFVSIGLGDKPMLQAIVRWVRSGSAGMEFVREIPEDRDEWQELIDNAF